MFLLWQGELTPLVVYRSKTMYMSSILLCTYATHPDAQFPQQADEIHLCQGYEANQPFVCSTIINIVNKELVLDVILSFQHIDSLKTMSV